MLCLSEICLPHICYSWEQRTDCVAMMGKIKICVFMFAAYLYCTMHAIIVNSRKLDVVLQSNTLISDFYKQNKGIHNGVLKPAGQSEIPGLKIKTSILCTRTCKEKCSLARSASISTRLMSIVRLACRYYFLVLTYSVMVRFRAHARYLHSAKTKAVSCVKLRQQQTTLS